MNHDKWTELLDKIEEKFVVVNQGREKLDELEGSYVDYIDFESPMGLVRLELTTRPRVQSPRGFGASKDGPASQMQKEHSPDDMVSVFTARREVDGEWEDIDAQGFI